MPYRNSVAENVFGVTGTICWTAQLIPQAWKSYHNKSTTGLSHWLLLLWGISAVLQGTYVLLQRLNIPLMVQPQLFGFLSLICWGQCQYYGLRRSRRTAIFLTALTIVFCGVLEFVLVLTIRPSHDRGKHTAADALGILSSVLVSVALFPQYWEIYKYKEVIGISMLFITVDILGGVFNLLSLVFKEKFDAIAAVTYAAVVVLDSVIVVAALILNPKARKRRVRDDQRAFSIHDSQDAIDMLHDTSRPVTPQLSESHSNSITSLTSTVVEEMEEGRVHNLEKPEEKVANEHST
ncbi:hypothetical protein D9613_006898 [Agrocybe pediades]|uniref:PQ-loop-domain-containing protein n=1 Tax=Agrocybe pediades TaxID=84607 RepID=A0A8H4QHB0_9AGAR|nr:hypothetical protein D9613_006898 [Agrocybe pediades]